MKPMISAAAMLSANCNSRQLFVDKDKCVP